MRPVGRPTVLTTFAVFPLLTTECPILITLEHPILMTLGYPILMTLGYPVLMTLKYPVLMTLEHPVLMTLEVGKNTELFLNDQIFSEILLKLTTQLEYP